MKKLPRYLYRGLRHEEIDAGCVLIPKAQRPFLAQARLPINLPFVLGERVEHAVREHQQVKKDKATGEEKPLHKTSGVSTTPHFQRAVQNYGRDGVIVKIDTSFFETHGISAHAVADFVDEPFICAPEDEEIILVCKKGYKFPNEIIVDKLWTRPPS
jgi:hypothetical protein